MKRKPERKVWPVHKRVEDGGPVYIPTKDDSAEAFRTRMAARIAAAKTLPVQNVEQLKRKRA